MLSFKILTRVTEFYDNKEDIKNQNLNGSFQKTELERDKSRKN